MPVMQNESRGESFPNSRFVRTICATFSTTRSNTGMPRIRRYVSGVLPPSETRSSSRPLVINLDLPPIGEEGRIRIENDIYLARLEVSGHRR
jgi:hypothetical protein